LSGRFNTAAQTLAQKEKDPKPDPFHFTPCRTGRLIIGAHGMMSLSTRQQSFDHIIPIIWRLYARNLPFAYHEERKKPRLSARPVNREENSRELQKDQRERNQGGTDWLTSYPRQN
jgi:hypothetical protein